MCNLCLYLSNSCLVRQWQVWLANSARLSQGGFVNDPPVQIKMNISWINSRQMILNHQWSLRNTPLERTKQGWNDGSITVHGNYEFKPSHCHQRGRCMAHDVADCVTAGADYRTIVARHGSTALPWASWASQGIGDASCLYPASCNFAQGIGRFWCWCSL